MAKQVNSDFYIVIYPWPETLEYGEEYFNWQEFAIKVCKLSNCNKLINSFPEFYNIKEKTPNWKKEYFILQDIHLNAKGYNLIANIIYKNIFN